MARILIVDDEKEITSLFSEVLVRSSEGRHKVVEANSSKNALKKIKKEGFDLVITDFQMKGINGRELCEKIRKQKKDMPVVLMTGDREIFETEEVRGYFDGVWAKPIDIKKLPKMVAKVLAKD